jgi:hypothetical protein
MKTYIHRHQSELLKRILTKSDAQTLADITGYKISTILEIIAGRKITERSVIDTVMKMALKRLDMYKIDLEKW